MNRVGQILCLEHGGNGAEQFLLCRGRFGRNVGEYSGSIEKALAFQLFPPGGEARPSGNRRPHLIVEPIANCFRREWAKLRLLIHRITDPDGGHSCHELLQERVVDPFVDDESLGGDA